MQSLIFHLRPNIKSYFFTLFLLFYFCLHANAALYDRGNGLIYDGVLKVTWLQDASYAKTSGDHTSAWMSWTDAIAWVDQLTYLGYTDWRLPKVLPINAQAYDLSWTNNGSTDQGYNISAPGSIYAGSGASELAFMFYNNLNNQGWVDLLGKEQPDENGLKNKGLFFGLNAGGYWSLTNYALATGRSLNFNFFNGAQESVDDQTYSFAWAVRDGDVTAVPISSAAWLLGSGLLGLFGLKSIKRRSFCLTGVTLLVGFALLLTSTSNAALVNYGNGMIYDTSLGITWLQDANLSAKEAFGVSGILSDGRMNWYKANEWIAAMNAADYLGYDNWRLPQTLPVNGLSYNYGISYTGATDSGYNISAPGSAYPGSKGSELAYMFYCSLGNKAYTDVNGNGPQPGWGLQNKGYFGNLQDDYDYWSGTVYGGGDSGQPYSAWTFIFSFGNQGSGDKMGNNFFVWAVRDGAPAGSPVPIPGAVWLLGSGLAGIIGYMRLRKSEVT